MKIKKHKGVNYMEEKNVKMAPPWVQYANAVNAMFGKDKEVEVVYNNDDKTLKLLVENPVKADALQQLLPVQKEFGNVVLKITVIPANKEMTKAQLYQAAFSNNPALRDVVPVEGVFTNPILYVIFAKEVVQYYNDDLSDAHGNRNTLYQEIAKEIFNHQDGVMYCTDVDNESTGKPLGEWP